MPRLSWRDPFWNDKRVPFVRAVVAASIALLLLFLADLSYLYGSLFKATSRIHNLNILAVDYDGGVLGSSLQGAYQELEGDNYLSLQFHPASNYPTVQDMRNAVCRGDYWGAVFVQSGASDRLSAALQGGSAASSYNASDVLTYITNGIHYPTVQNGDIVSNLQKLGPVATIVYDHINGTSAAQTANLTDPAAVAALLSPITISSINIQPSIQTDTDDVLYNTITIVMAVIQMIFGTMLFNALMGQFNLFSHASHIRIAATSSIFGLAFTFLTSLCSAGYIWAFRESWNVDSNQFALTWMAFWLFMHVNFVMVFAVVTWCPLPSLPFILLTWVIINVTSTLYPFELSAGFYRWGYAIPGHEFVAILFQIWSGGCNNQLYRALPILFAWEVLGHGLVVLGFWRKHQQTPEAFDEIEASQQAELREREKQRKESHGDEHELIQIHSESGNSSSQAPLSPLTQHDTQHDTHYETHYETQHDGGRAIETV